MRRRRQNPEASWLPWAIAAGLVGLGAVAVGPALIASAKELLLEPETRRRYLELKARLKARGIGLHTGSTGRNEEQQQAAIDAGKSSTSVSWHMVGRAVDAYVIPPGSSSPDMAGARGD